MRVCTVVGARPQFVKAAPVSRALAAGGHTEILIHTGQHYDRVMSDIFFEEIGQRAPDYNLGVGSGSHGVQTGQMMIALEPILQAERPDAVLVYGDTNSTLAAAVVAVKLGVPLAHVEAGLRSFNRSMPEEHNRRLTDHVSDWLFCPTATAVENLRAEGLTRGVYQVGDVMYDAVRYNLEHAAAQPDALPALGLEPGGYYLATIHRPYNTDRLENLTGIWAALADLKLPVVFPMHPRTRRLLEAAGVATPGTIRVIDPVGHLGMLRLEKQARAILTDSGGVQKEAYFLAVPCVTIRPETEWVETVAAGWNTLAQPTLASLEAALAHPRPAQAPPPVFGDGQAAQHMVALLTQPANQTKVDL
jgi:UDP-GlcNAc3NAcA epimerase